MKNMIYNETNNTNLFKRYFCEIVYVFVGFLSVIKETVDVTGAHSFAGGPTWIAIESIERTVIGFILMTSASAPPFI